MRLLFQLWLAVLLLGATMVPLQPLSAEQGGRVAAHPAHTVACAPEKLEQHAPGKVAPKLPLHHGWMWLSAAHERFRFGRARRPAARSTSRAPRVAWRLYRRRLPRLRDDKAEPG